MKNIYQEAILQSMTEIEANSAGRGFDNTYNNGRTSAFNTAIEIIKSNLSLADKKEKAQQAATASFGKFWDAVREMNDAVKQLSTVGKKQFPSGGIAPNGPEILINPDGSQREAHVVKSSLVDLLKTDLRAHYKNHPLLPKYQENIFKLNDGDLNHFSDALKYVLLNGSWNVDVRAKLKNKSDKLLDKYSIKRYGVKYASLAIPNKRHAVQRAAFAAMEKMYLEEFDKIQRKNSNLEEQLCVANNKIAEQQQIFKELKVECGKLEANVVEIEKNVDFWVYQTERLKKENQNLLNANNSQASTILSLNKTIRATPNVFGTDNSRKVGNYEKKTDRMNQAIALLLAIGVVVFILLINSFIKLDQLITSWF